MSAFSVAMVPVPESTPAAFPWCHVLVLAILLSVAAVTLMSVWAAVYLYGRFAHRARGEPSCSLPVSEPATQIDEMVGPLLRDRHDETGLCLLDTGLNAFAARALTARRAGRSLDLQYYIWKRDLTGRLLAAELLKAADRGVRVRLLVDDLNAPAHDKTHLTLDSHPNISVRVFNPTRNREGTFGRGIELLLRAFTSTRRMHNKAWIADGQVAIVGGRNIGDAYFDAGGSPNFRDLDLLVVGAEVERAAAIFDGYWNSPAALPIRAFRQHRRTDLGRLRRLLAYVERSLKAQPYLERVRERSTIESVLADRNGMHWTSIGKVVSDPPEKAMGDRQKQWLMNFITPKLSAATSTLDLISPYFVPQQTGTELLLGLAQRGVRVRLLTNSLAATDVMAVHGAYARYRSKLIAGNVSLFELKPYEARKRSSLFGSRVASLHTKAFIIDGRSGFVGSMNFDPRSISLNCEMGIYFEHPELAGEICRIFTEQISPQKSYRLHLEKGHVCWEDLADGKVCLRSSEPKAGFWRRLAATVIGFLPIESQL